MAKHDGILKEIIILDNKELERNIKALSRFDTFLNKIPQDDKIFLPEPFSQGLSYGGLLRAELLLSGSSLERNRLRISRAILKRLRITSGLLRKLDEDKRMDNERLFDLFSMAGGAVRDFSFLTMRQGLVAKAKRFMVAKPVLTAERIMGVGRLVPGPELGKVLEELRKLYFLGKIKNEKDAVAWLSGRF
jgi:hypothetical protein